ncbi:MAG: VanZ family protein [Bacteroidota bacterium]
MKPQRKTYRMLTNLWAFFILILCVIPGKDLPSSNIWQIDKVAHFILYLVFAFLLLASATNTLYKTQWIVLACCLIYGFAIECMQGLFLPDRFFDWYDVMANSVGAIVGVGLFHLVKHHLIHSVEE